MNVQYSGLAKADAWQGRMMIVDCAFFLGGGKGSTGEWKDTFFEDVWTCSGKIFILWYHHHPEHPGPHQYPLPANRHFRRPVPPCLLDSSLSYTSSIPRSPVQCESRVTISFSANVFCDGIFIFFKGSRFGCGEYGTCRADVWG
jgi:hypothetical protein